MSLILVSDVFGMTPALAQLSEALNADCIIDPYNGVNMDFSDEAQAYAYFIENVGLDAYLMLLKDKLEAMPSGIVLIGFSVGASAIWRFSETVPKGLVKKAIFYYGSQIRNFIDITPNIKTELIFPQSEPHFDVAVLQSQLSERKNVTTRRVEYLHGFMNKHSDNYNQAGYDIQIEWLKNIDLLP